jgi:hypothetical protein
MTADRTAPRALRRVRSRSLVVGVVPSTVKNRRRKTDEGRFAVKMSDLMPENKHMLCFVGKGGHGKSIGASYWPKPMFYASCDSRAHSVYNWWSDRDPSVLKEIEVETYTASEYEKLAIKIENLQMKNPFRSIVIDPLTFIALMMIDYVIAQKGGQGVVKHGRLTLAGPDEYKGEVAGMKKLFDAGRVLKSHFILVAHVLEETHYVLGDDKPHLRRSLFTAGKQPAAMIPGMFDEVWLFGVKPSGQPGVKPDYMINTCPTAEFETLRTSCNMPSEFKWTNKNLYEIAAPYLNKYGKKDVEAPKVVTS